MHIRDKEIFILFVTAFAFVFILICSGYSAISSWMWQYAHNKTSYEYSENFYIHSANSYTANYIDFEQASKDGYYDLYEDDMRMQEECLELCKADAEKMIDIISKQENTTYVNLTINVGEGILEYQEASIIFSYKEEWYGDLAEGEYPPVDTNGIYAVIGENLVSETVEKNNRLYIWIADTYVEVTGIMENYNSSGDDYSLIIFGGEKFLSESEQCRDRLIELMNNDEIYIVMGSNETLISNDKLKNDINKNDNLYLGEPGYMLKMDISQNDATSESLWEYMYNIKLFVICLMVLFAVCNCAMLSKIWAIRRRKDFLVMHIYGLKNRKIMKLVFKEQIVMAGLGLIIGLIVSLVYVSISSGWNKYDYMVLWFGLSFVIGLFFILFCCMISVYVYIRKLKPSQAARL